MFRPLTALVLALVLSDIACAQPYVKVIPTSPVSTSEFSGLALLAARPTSVVLKAMDADGAMIAGAGIQNPVTITLSRGEQYARLLSEIFGFQTFDGWIEATASAAGLGIYVADGAWDLANLDGFVVHDTSSDFVLFHAGGSANLLNPSTRAATVTITPFGTGSAQSLTIPPRSRVRTTLAGPSRVRSSEPLAAMERIEVDGKLAMSAGASVSDEQSTLVFPHAVIGGGYTSTLALANALSDPLDLTITYGGSTGTLQLNPNTAARVSVAEFLRLTADTIHAGTLRVSAKAAASGLKGLVLGVLDLDSSTDISVVGARPATLEFVFPHVAQGNGLFTGLAFATGDRSSGITIEAYDPVGGTTTRRENIQLEANQQISKLVGELVPSAAMQNGGYLRVYSEQPIWAWEFYGSDRVIASVPPLESPWTFDWSHGTCTGSGPGRLTVSPMKPADIGMILPLGTMVGDHVTPIDHQYYYPANFRSAADAYDVYSPFDGNIVQFGVEKELVNPPDKISVIIESSCTFWVWYHLLTSVTADLRPSLPAPGGVSEVRIPVKAGQLIGRIGGRTLDFSIVNSEVTLAGFVVPEHYTIGEGWKIHTVDPTSYYDEPIRSQLSALNLRTVEPRGGRIDYDVDGRLIGNWFLEGTPGYAGLRYEQPQLSYSASHLAIVPDAIDPAVYTISIGSLLPSQQNQFGIKGNTPDPAKVSVATGLVKYELTDLKYVDGTGQFYTHDHYASGVHRSDNQTPLGTVLFQMIDDRHIRFEVFMGKTASQVTGFTNAAQIYQR